MILFDFCCTMGETWEKIAVEEGITLRSFSPAMLENREQREKALEALAFAGPGTAVIYADHGMNDRVESFLRELPKDVLLIPLGADALLCNPGNVPREAISRINTYVTYGGEENIRRMLRCIRHDLVGEAGAPEPGKPVEMPFDGIYDVRSRAVYDSLPAFLAAAGRRFPRYVGILSHRSSWLSGNLETERALEEAFRKIDVGVIPVFCAGETGEKFRSLTFLEIADRFFTENGKLLIGGLINFQLHLIKGQNGQTVAETAMDYFSRLGVPEFHPISSFFTTWSKWKIDNNPLSQEMPMDYGNPEMAGLIEPVLLSVRDEERKKSLPIPQNTAAFAGRVKKWLALREKPNREKKIAIMLHNCVCSGVEATVGKAFGLDAFGSAVAIMERMRRDGYDIQNIPADGRALRKLILEKKAISDFRWTSAEDIAEAGGCLYRMPVRPEYDGYFREFPPDLQQAMLDSWGPAPGEGMVLGNDLLVTGLRFGNLLVMVQPKRGCYGAKCTGEVCRILHDPLCPPAHQYIATYRYLERNFEADAVIHLGTDGSLEYLPGKSSGLGAEDWPYAVLGTLPNIYPYHLGVTAEATIAKRRASAVLVGYYPSGAGGLCRRDLSLMEKIRAYCEARQMENGQEQVLRQELEPIIAGRSELQKLMDTAGSFFEGVQMVRDSLLRCAQGRKISDLHIFGENPDEKEIIRYLVEVIRADRVLPREEGEEEFDYERRLWTMAEEVLSGGGTGRKYGDDLRTIAAGLRRTTGEMDRLMELLAGMYQPASEGGMPDENGRNILPTGRNFYMMNMDKIPTRVAYQKGWKLAAQLLEAYQRDEGRLPRKIAMNMISLDISRTQGEQMCQFLSLMGIRPQWDEQERVTGLEAVPVSELGHPRIDITLRISGVMRDTWPDAVVLLDEAVMLAAAQPESEADNFILANIRKMEEEWGKMGRRSRTIRIFGDPPGAFGAGIDLALKASAWETDRDLARYFIQSSAYAYGKGLSGRKSVREFVQNARDVELTADVTSSRRMDTLSCGFGLQVHGGFKLLAETIGGKKVRQYQSVTEIGTTARTESLTSCVENDIHQTLLNPVWVENTMEQDYIGGAEIMHRIQNVFDAQATSEVVEDRTLDMLAETYLNDEQMRQWLLAHNAYAAEEIGRRLLELESRGKWKPKEEILEKLRENYLGIEGFMEGGTTGNGEIQGGSVEIIKDEQVENWKKAMKDIDAFLDELN